jgi:hypothetical protein
MTLDEENKLISEISAISRVPMDMVKAVLDTQMVRFMKEIGTVQQSSTFFGKIELRDGELVLVSTGERIKEFITRNKLAARMISEVPNK